MAEEDKKFSKQLIGKTVVSKTGKRFGVVGDLVFETRSGELIHLVINDPTSYTAKLELEKENSTKEEICKKICASVTKWIKTKRVVSSSEIFKILVQELKKHNEDAAFLYETHRDIS